MKLTVWTLSALLVTCAAFAQDGVKRLPVEVWRDAEAGRAVEFCLPLAQGELADVNAVRAVNDKGQEMPLQVRVLSSWPQDKSLRVLWLSVFSDKQPMTVEFGKGVQRKAAATKLSVEQQADGVSITTGPLRFRVSSKELKLLDQVWLDRNADGKFTDDEAMLVAPGATPVLTTLEGKKYVPAGAPEVVVEDSGPLYATVRIRGELMPEDKKDAPPEERFQVTYRVKAWAGSPTLSVQHLLKRLGQPFVMKKVSEEYVKREWELLVPVERFGVCVRVKPAGAGLSYAAGGDGKIVDQGKGSGAQTRLMMAGGEPADSKPTVRFKQDGPPEAGALRWLDVSAAQAGVAMAVRDAAELWPKACEVSGSGAVWLDLWRDNPPYAVLEVGSGFQRAHDFVLLFHGNIAGAENGESAAKLTMPSRAAVPAEQFRRSKVFGAMPASLNAFPEAPGFVKALTASDAFSRYRNYGDHLYGLAAVPNVSKMMRYNDRSDRERWNPLTVRCAMYAMTGERQYLEDADRMGRWFRDWYLKHRLLDGTAIVQTMESSNSLVLFEYTKEQPGFPGSKEVAQALAENKRRLGVLAQYIWCRTGPCWRIQHGGYEGPLYHYFLTGDPVSLETAREGADILHFLATSPAFFGSPSHSFYIHAAAERFHLLGPLMENLAIFYEGLGDAKYLDGLKTVMVNLMKGARMDTFPDDEPWLWRSYVARMTDWTRSAERFSRSTYEYYRLTGDEKIKVHADKVARSLAMDRFDNERREFFGFEKNSTTKRVYSGALGIQLSISIGWCYLTTGDSQYMGTADKGYFFVVDWVKEKQKDPKFPANMPGLYTGITGALLLENYPGYLYAREKAASAKR
jgi:hypothetical protein